MNETIGFLDISKIDGIHQFLSFQMIDEMSFNVTS